MRYIEVIEECLGKKAEMNMLPMQPGDVPDTCGRRHRAGRRRRLRPRHPDRDRHPARSSIGIATFIKMRVERYTFNVKSAQTVPMASLFEKGRRRHGEDSEIRGS